MDYRQSGVDIDAGNETVRRIRSLARGTFTPGVLSEIGSFGGLFRLDRERYREPVLVSSADGVGTKLKVAFMTGRHDTVGADLVNHCVNDILVQGAEPLFFLDYLATGRLSPDVAEQVVAGVARGVPRERLRAHRRRDGRDARLLRRRRVRHRRLHRRRRRAATADRRHGRSCPGDVLIGLPSAGLHTNGYSLARRVLFELRRARARDASCRSSARRSARRCSRRTGRICRSSGRCSSGELVQGHGAHHRRRHHREPAAHPARGLRRGDRPAWRGPCRRSSACCSSAAASPRDEMFRAFNMGIGLIVACAAAGRPSA